MLGLQSAHICPYCFFKSEYNCFVMCSFLLYNEINQLYVYVYALALEPPPTPSPPQPSRSSQSPKLSALHYTAASHWAPISHLAVQYVNASLPVHLILPLGTYFTPGSAACQPQSPSSSHPPSRHVHWAPTSHLAAQYVNPSLPVHLILPPAMSTVSAPLFLSRVLLET